MPLMLFVKSRQPLSSYCSVAVGIVVVVAAFGAHNVSAQIFGPHLFGPRAFHVGGGKLGKFGPVGYGHLADARFGSIGKLHYGQIGGLYGNSFVGAANPFARDAGNDDESATANMAGQQTPMQSPPMDPNVGWAHDNNGDAMSNGDDQPQQFVAQPQPTDGAAGLWMDPVCVETSIICVFLSVYITIYIVPRKLEYPNVVATAISGRTATNVVRRSFWHAATATDADAVDAAADA